MPSYSPAEPGTKLICMERQQSLDHLTHPSSHNHQQHQQRQEKAQDHQTPDPTTSVSPQISSMVSARYRECLKNHAAKMGGNVTDGCGEFMPSGEEGSGPDFFKCAACGCHRSFHRKETSEAANRYLDRIRTPTYGMFSPLSAHPADAVMMTFGGGAESSSEDRDLVFRPDGGDQTLQFGAQKRRFRTKFTREQKEKMAEFAEKIEWRIQKDDEQELVQFCTRIGVKRQVFKVWMHNNKQAMKKKNNKKEQQ